MPLRLMVELFLGAGRVMDFIESGKLATDAVKFFVLDEADRLLDKGSQELVMKLFSKLPKAATGTQRLQVHALTVWITLMCEDAMLLMSAVLIAVKHHHTLASVQ